MKQPESELQQACVYWFRSQYPKAIIASFPNGQKRTVEVSKAGKFYVPSANRQLAEGMLPGMPDIIILFEKRLPLFIEMKSEKGVLSDNQKRVQPKLVSLGFTVVICYSFDEFKETVEKYLREIK